MEALLSIALGIGLATACGFRVFVPFLVAGMAARADLLPLAGGFEWLESTGALLVLAAATVAEVLAYSIPWIDNLLDTLATPLAVLAGIVVAAAVVVDLPPVARWSLAIIAGGGIAGVVQGGTVVVRGLSSITTGGFGNFLVSLAELAGAALMSVLTVLAPLLAATAAITLVVIALRIGRRRQARRTAEVRHG